MHDYLGGGIRGEGGIPLCIGGIEDHVHILARLRQDKAISAVIGAIKANSSGWIHRTFPDLSAFAWQAGYGAFTVSKSQEVSVHKYIEGQEEHHRVKPYRDELIEMLNEHEIEYNEKYLWD